MSSTPRKNLTVAKDGAISTIGATLKAALNVGSQGRQFDRTEIGVADVVLINQLKSLLVSDN